MNQVKQNIWLSKYIFARVAVLMMLVSTSSAESEYSSVDNNDIKVECLSSSIVVSVLPSFYENEGVQLSDLHLRDYTCGGINVISESGTLWVFNIPTFSSCSTELKKNTTHLIFSNTLSNIAYNSLYTGVPSNVTFSCIYETKVDILSFSFNYSVVTNVVNIVAPSEEGKFEAEMNLYTSNEYSAIEKKKSFKPTDILYIKAKVYTEVTGINLIIEKCWVSPTFGVNNQPEYSFINNRCPVTNGKGKVKITQSGNGTTASFSSQVFAFVGYDTVFLHCSLEICLSTPGESCVPSCHTPAASARKRRSEGKFTTTLTRARRQAREQSDATEDKHIVSLGPYVVAREPVDDVNTDSHQPALSVGALVAILTSLIVIFLFIVFFVIVWFRFNQRQVPQGKLNFTGFTNHVLTTD